MFTTVSFAHKFVSPAFYDAKISLLTTNEQQSTYECDAFWLVFMAAMRSSCFMTANPPDFVRSKVIPGAKYPAGTYRRSLRNQISSPDFGKGAAFLVDSERGIYLIPIGKGESPGFSSGRGAREVKKAEISRIKKPGLL